MNGRSSRSSERGRNGLTPVLRPGSRPRSHTCVGTVPVVAARTGAEVRPIGRPARRSYAEAEERKTGRVRVRYGLTPAGPSTSHVEARRRPAPVGVAIRPDGAETFAARMSVRTAAVGHDVGSVPVEGVANEKMEALTRRPIAVTPARVTSRRVTRLQILVLRVVGPAIEKAGVPPEVRGLRPARPEATARLMEGDG